MTAFSVRTRGYKRVEIKAPVRRFSSALVDSPWASSKNEIVLCYGVLCYVVMLCYVALRCVMLCYVMLCYVMVCYVVRPH